ncbi:hypothetical protein ACJMK2_035588 [Sinanodonta woodiana]|uniref:HAT C-terminal dimerisation domain-containing protein n=1 Tax=Sinanodonta woodiana TaxID=1069815 RepID=A0ABD3WW12_SINWO
MQTVKFNEKTDDLIQVLLSSLPLQTQLPPVQVTERDNRPAATSEDLFGDVYVVKVEPSKSLFQRADTEITRYRNETSSIHIGDNPLMWWKFNETSFLLLAKLCHLKVFSTAGDVVSAQRAYLTGGNVDILILLKKYMKL